MKRIALLGSTGSIGRQTLEVIASLGDQYRVVALTAGRNHRLIAEQAARFRPEMVSLFDSEAAERLKNLSLQDSIKISSGAEGQVAAAAWPGADLVVMAQVGFSGFKPLVAALEAGKTIALANKESLVVGGDLLERMNLLDKKRIIPVDSEHSAIWQAIGTAEEKEISRVFLTASGGPFFGMTGDDLKQIKPVQALKHPNWTMGPKITIDSATMMNKGLEVIEAKWLFDLELSQIEVVVHRQSIVHSMVEYIDGTIMAQLGSPDMRAPIQHALTYPARKKGLIKQYNPFGSLTFEEPDRKNFPCLDLAFRAVEAGGTMPAVLNAANEIAVEQFLRETIKFTDIPVIIEAVMAEHQPVKDYFLEDAVEADRQAREKAESVVKQLIGKVR